MNSEERTSLQLRSLVKKSGELEVSLVSVVILAPAANQVMVRILASPINPSDLGLLFGAADLSTARASGTAMRPVITARIPLGALSSMSGRLDISMPVGNEGAGLVVEAGSHPAAQALLGKMVAVSGGGMYSQYRNVPADDCLLLPDGATAADGASAFVNPLTALGMVEAMRRDGHTALVHTAAASALGIMLNRICIHDHIGLVNIVRRPEQEGLLRAIGAVHVCNSSSARFTEDLTDAIAATGATIAFDATGGGKLAGQILTCMEAVFSRTTGQYSRYGSTTHKQVYIYGNLDPSPTELNRDVGMAWAVGGWLTSSFLLKLGSTSANMLKQRVATELKTTFATSYSKEVSLTEALRLDAVAVYSKRATGAKYLINPSKDLR
jgi:NADPH2:quinone reductase